MTVHMSKRKQLSNAPLQNKVTPGSWAQTTKNFFLFGFQNRNCVCASCSVPLWHKVFPERKWKFWGKRGDLEDGKRIFLEMGFLTRKKKKVHDTCPRYVLERKLDRSVFNLIFENVSISTDFFSKHRKPT